MNFVRSAIAPETIVAEVAQKTDWNRKKVQPSSGFTAKTSAEVGRKKRVPQNAHLSSPHIRPKPTAKNASEPTAKSITFFIMMLTAFFERLNPASTSMKPSCMKKTRKVAISTQRVFRPAEPAGAPTFASSSSAALTVRAAAAGSSAGDSADTLCASSA